MSQPPPMPQYFPSSGSSTVSEAEVKKIEASEKAEEAKKEPHWSGVFGFILAIVGFIIAIVALVIASRNSKKIGNILNGNTPVPNTGGSGSSNWTIAYGTSTSGTDTYTANPNSIYANISTSTTALALKVVQGSKPASGVGQMFIVDNTSGAAAINLTFYASDGTTSLGTYSLPVGSSRQFMWVLDSSSNNGFRRYWTTSA